MQWRVKATKVQFTIKYVGYFNLLPTPLSELAHQYVFKINVDLKIETSQLWQGLSRRENQKLAFNAIVLVAVLL